LRYVCVSVRADREEGCPRLLNGGRLQGFPERQGLWVTLWYDAPFRDGDATFFRGAHRTGYRGTNMIAEVIEKGDATFTIKYKAENGQEAMIISMMATAVTNTSVTATLNSISIGYTSIPVIGTLLRKFSDTVAK
jgi:hypothetical protein